MAKDNDPMARPVTLVHGHPAIVRAMGQFELLRLFVV